MPARKALTTQAIIAALTLTLTSCGSNGEIADGNSEAFTFGLLYPQTGTLAFLGPPQLASAEYAIADINEAGGILGTEVPELTQADEAGESGQANDAANSLVADEVNAVIGASASNMTQAVYDTITGAEIVQCSGSNTAAELTNIDDDGYFFRTAPSDLMAGPVLAQQIVDDGHRTVALAARADDYGSGYLHAVQDELESHGVQVVLSEAYDPDTANFGAVIEGLSNAQADAVALISFEEGTQVLAALLEGEVEGDQIYVTDGLNDPELGSTVSDDPTLITGATGVAPSADNSEFNEGLTEFQPDLEVLQYAPHVYDCVTAIALAAESADSVEPTEYVSHLADVTRPEGTECTTFAECRDLLDDGEDIDYQGASGDIDFDDNGDPTSATFEVFGFDGETHEVRGYEE